MQYKNIGEIKRSLRDKVFRTYSLYYRLHKNKQTRRRRKKIKGHISTFLAILQPLTATILEKGVKLRTYSIGINGKHTTHTHYHLLQWTNIIALEPECLTLSNSGCLKAGMSPLLNRVLKIRMDF